VTTVRSVSATPGLDELLADLVRSAVREAVAEALASVTAPSPSRSALTLAQTADVTGLSERTVRRMVADGRLRSIRSGRAVRIPAGAVDELLRGGTA
jgi:excisionase family DNA binding protein